MFRATTLRCTYWETKVFKQLIDKIMVELDQETVYSNKSSRTVLSAIRNKFNVDAKVEMYMENRPDARRWAESPVWAKLGSAGAQISHHAGVVNWGFMVFLLSGFGTYMNVALFWVSWAVLVIETVVLSTLQPFFSWLEDEVLHPPPQRHSLATHAVTNHLQTDNSTARAESKAEQAFAKASAVDDSDCSEPSDGSSQGFVWQRAAAGKVEGSGATILTELTMLYKLWTPLLKLPFVAVLLVLITSTTFTGDLCARGSTCYSRLKESLVAMITLFFALEWLPCVMAVTFSTTDIPTFLASKMKAADVWVSILHDTCSLVSVPASVAALRARVLSDSISLTEVLAWEFRLMKGRPVSKDSKELVARITSTIWRQEWYRMLAFFTSSASAVLTLTVALLVGGSFGSFMTKKTYWVCWAFVSTEAIAESIMYITFFAVGKGGMRVLVRVSWTLRFVAHAVLFALMVDVIARRDYYAVDIRPECDEICRERGIGLLRVACALSGIQCLSFVTSYYAWHVLTFLHLAASAFSFVYRRVLDVVGFPWAVIVGFVLPLFCRALVRSLLWLQHHLFCRRSSQQVVSTSIP